jgi:4-hydroxy-tetrahydrodipicolinate synthase
MIQGSMVALVTPMTDDNQLDWDALNKLVDWHLEKGTHAIVAVGTTGESATLNVTEHLEVVRRIVAQVAGRIPVIAGTGANATAEAIELTRAAKDAGADACLLVTPYYNKPTQEGLYLHFKAIADAVEIPQVLYNVPGRTGVDMLPATVLRLVEHKNIIGIKEATGDLERAKQLIDATANVSFDIISGDDATAVEMILMGGTGEITVTANIAPEQVAKMCSLALAGDAAGARALNDLLMPVHDAMFVEANPIPVKWACAQMGLIRSGIRLPLTPLSEIFRAPLLAALKTAKIV